MGLFEKSKKGLSHLFTLDGIASLYASASFILSTIGAYVMTQLAWFDHLPEFMQVLIIINTFAVLLVSLIALYWIANKIKNWWHGRVREQKLSIARGHVQNAQFEEDLDCTLVEFQCFAIEDGKYQCLPDMSKRSDLKHLKDKTFDVHKLVFTNRGDEPIFKIQVPFRYECCVKNDETGKYQYIVHSGNTHFFGVDNESIMPGESLTFCFCNASENDYLIVMHLLDYVEANLFNEDKAGKIRYTWETLRPLHFSLRHIPNYYVDR